VTELPEFRLHGYDQKFEALSEDCPPLPAHTLHYIALMDEMTSGLEGVKILDIGCGRGELVRALRQRGARAFGIEIDPRFIESGKILNDTYVDEYPVLSVLRANGSSLFPDGYFDLVISDQVLEHVAQLDSFTAEVARVLRPRGITLHQFPAQRIITEPHYSIPFAHWLPKNSIRYAWIKAMLSAGYAKKFFPELALSDRAHVIYKYSAEETFYRSSAAVRAAFVGKGIASDGLNASRIYLRQRFGFSNVVLAWLMRTFRNSLYSGTRVVSD